MPRCVTERPRSGPSPMEPEPFHLSSPQAMRYFEVEARFAPVSPDCLVLTAERCVRVHVNVCGEGRL